MVSGGKTQYIGARRTGKGIPLLTRPPTRAWISATPDHCADDRLHGTPPHRYPQRPPPGPAPLPVKLRGRDGALGPDADLTFLVGDWEAESLIVRSKENLDLAQEFIGELGAEYTLSVEASGQYT